jgi:hypothetical protein
MILALVTTYGIYFDPCSLYQRSPHDRSLSYSSGRKNDSSINYPRKKPVPDPSFSIPDPGMPKIPVPDPHQRIKAFLSQKTDTKFSKIRSGMLIPYLDFFLFQITYPGAKKAPDPQHCKKTFTKTSQKHPTLLSYYMYR